MEAKETNDVWLSVRAFQFAVIGLLALAATELFIIALLLAGLR